MMQSKKFRNKITGEIVTQVPLSQIRNFELFVEPAVAESAGRIESMIKGDSVTVENTAQMGDAINWIVANGQFLIVNKVMIDGVTAGVIKQVMDALKPANREKFLDMGIRDGVAVMGGCAWDCITNAGKR
jgi:Fe2+ transport system protein FeoA